MKLIFATHNLHKAKEIRSVLPKGYELKHLDEMGIHEDIPETGDTLQANALIKARYVFEKTGEACFADDTGLEVETLNGAPGVYSARYARGEASFEHNTDKLLREMQGKEDRRAAFRTVIAYITSNGREHLFEGKVEGVITEEKRGEKGFGYDPVFLPDGYSQTFAEMSLEEKNKISHRARAFAEFLTFLNNE